MNREIKFRAWNKVDKNGMIDLKKITPLATTVTDGLFLPFDDNIVLMQFTGLKDKNGKEIYEGDILKIEEDKIVEVIFNNACFRTPYGNSAYRLGGWRTDQIEIIGNIHESPDLIKGGGK